MIATALCVASPAAPAAAEPAEIQADQRDAARRRRAGRGGAGARHRPDQRRRGDQAPTATEAIRAECRADGVGSAALRRPESPTRHPDEHDQPPARVPLCGEPAAELTGYRASTRSTSASATSPRPAGSSTPWSRRARTRSTGRCCASTSRKPRSTRRGRERSPGARAGRALCAGAGDAGRPDLR